MYQHSVANDSLLHQHSGVAKTPCLLHQSIPPLIPSRIETHGRCGTPKARGSDDVERRDRHWQLDPLVQPILPPRRVEIPLLHLELGLLPAPHQGAILVLYLSHF